MLTVQTLSSLDQDDVQANLDLLTSQVQALNPDIDAKRGAFHDLLLYLSAVLATAQQENIDILRKSNSLLAVTEDPSLADDDVLDRLASNYLVTRREGATASGQVTVVLARNQQTTIGSGVVFTSGSLTFTTPRMFIGRTDEDLVLTDNDVLIRSLGDGTYAMTIEVDATENGTVYNIARGSQFTTAVGSLNITSTYAAEDFTGGEDEETNQQLLERLRSGLAGKNPSNRMTLDGMIRADEDFATIPSLSVVGFGDAEMVRYHSIFPVAFGGRVDVYARTAAMYENRLLSKTGTLVSKVGSLGTWQISLGRNEAPGLYEVTAITQPADAGLGIGYTITSDTRSLDVTVASPSVATPSTSYIPDVTTALEAAYSRYATAVIRFEDTDTNATALSIGATHDYAVGVRVMPDIDALQDLLSERPARNAAGDILVKAPVPCILAVDISINVIRNTTSPTEDEVKEAVAASINALGFTGTVSALKTAADVQASMPSGSTVQQVSLSGYIRKPNGSYTTLVASLVGHTVASDPTNMTTARTVGFFCHVDDVTVTLTTVDPTEV